MKKSRHFCIHKKRAIDNRPLIRPAYNAKAVVFKAAPRLKRSRVKCHYDAIVFAKASNSLGLTVKHPPLHPAVYHLRAYFFVYFAVARGFPVMSISASSVSPVTV